MDRLRILVVEDDAIIAEDVCVHLEDLGHVALGPAYTSLDAQTLARKHTPHVAILDIHLSETDSGIDLAAWFKANIPIPIIFLTAYADERTLGKAKEVHPEQYLLKPFSKLQLKVAVEIAGHNYYNPDSEQQKELKIYRLNSQLLDPLSRREIEVLLMLNEGHSNQQIAEKLFITEHTVKSHLKNIFAKTGAQSRTDLLSRLNVL